MLSIESIVHMYINVQTLCWSKNISDKLDNQRTYGTYILVDINGSIIYAFDIALPNTPYLVKVIW